jgi:3-deoxy-D-arabino-heptulosonate 7-phosphate (DAHP) synthase class II
MPFLFSHVEYCYMHYVYGYCNVNASASVNEYRRRYPERRIPSKRVFTRVEQALRDNDCLTSFALHSEREIVRTINTRENILDMVQRSPRLSTCRMASRFGLSRMNVWRTLHEENLYPYHDQRVQHLEPGDHAQRMDLCHWVNAHPELLNVILFTDEASFTRDGINNLRNVHTWAHRNPHVTCATHFQMRFSLNV